MSSPLQKYGQNKSRIWNDFSLLFGSLAKLLLVVFKTPRIITGTINISNSLKGFSKVRLFFPILFHFFQIIQIFPYKTHLFPYKIQLFPYKIHLFPYKIHLLPYKIHLFPYEIHFLSHKKQCIKTRKKKQ